jgi:hypothetical protein
MKGGFFMPVVTALADTTTFDISSISSALASGSISALNTGVSDLTPIIVAVVAVNLVVRLFRKFVA